jgi:16S rRNA (adenine1518-N6/adenine1519-N6)-dimethyltransferase
VRKRHGERGDRRPARRRFGQHFLEAAWVVKVVQAIAPSPTDVFYEIGPGRGALTRELAARSRRVVAFEIDRDLAGELGRSAPANLEVVVGDFLRTDWIRRQPADQPVRVAGNLPYNVASPILFTLVGLYNDGIPLTDATVMLQREVADRLLASPGSKDYGVLSILIQLSAGIDRLLALPPGAFRPVPNVHSALVRLRFHRPDPAPRDLARFARLAQTLFSHRRKTLENALMAWPGLDRTAAGAAIRQAGLDGRRRPETLELAELVRLAAAVDLLPGGGPAML